MAVALVSISKGMPNLDEHRKKRIDAFAPYVAILPWFSVDVLHKLYLNIFDSTYEEDEEVLKNATPYELRAITCADFLHSPHVTRIDYNVFVIEDGTRESLREQIKEDKDQMQKLGEFMLSYAKECRHQFLGIRYREVYKIEGQLIINPLAAASSISSHIATQLKKKLTPGQKAKEVAYFLNFIDQDETRKGYKELITFLEGTRDWIKGDKEKAQDKLSQLNYKEEIQGESITVKLPVEVKKKILENFKKKTGETPSKKKIGSRQVYALLVGIGEYLPPVPPLDSAINDVRAMRDYFKNNVDPEKLHLEVLENEQATRKNVIDTFKSHLSQAGESDIACFYFSGHGSQEPAHEAFWHLEPDKKNETIVCYDSRSADGFDLADKELSNLINIVAENDPHILVIMDSCHSGPDKLRSEKDAVQVPISEVKRPIDSYFLSQEQVKFLQEEKNIEIPNPRHILLSATLSHQLSKETQLGGSPRGLFTYSLLEVLTSRTFPITYEDLLYQVRNLVSQRAKDQTPQLYSPVVDDKDMIFLGGTTARKTNYFGLSYDREDNEWSIDAGTVHGILPGNANEETLLTVYAKDANESELEDVSLALGQISVKSISNERSSVRLEGDLWLDKETQYRAVIYSMPIQAMKVFFVGDEGEGLPLLIRALEQSLEGDVYLSISDNIKAADYLLHINNNQYVVTRTSDSIDQPLIEQLKGYTIENAEKAIENLVHIARWKRTLELKNPSANLSAKSINISIYEPDQDKEILPGSNGYSFRYKKSDGKTAWPRFRIRLNNNSGQRLYVSLLYLSSSFEINPATLPGGGIWLDSGEKAWALNGRAITASVSDANYNLGRKSIQETFKLIMSTSEINAKLMRMKELNDPETVSTRSKGKVITNTRSLLFDDSLDTETYADWTTNDIQILVQSLDEVETLPKTSHFTWCLDNGHGKQQKGKRSPVAEDGSQLLEYEINRDIVVRITKQLDQLGIDYFEVAPEVEEIASFLEERVERVNTHETTRTKLLVSVHSNVGPDSKSGWTDTHGIETWHLDNSEEGKILASVFQKHLVAETGWQDRNIRSKAENEFYILRKADCTTILTENGFYNNREQFEELKKDSVRQNLADAHVKAIQEVEERYETIFEEGLKENSGQDLKTYINETKEILAQDEPEKIFLRLDALSKTLSLTKGTEEEDILTDIILLEQRWWRLNLKVDQGILSPGESRLERNKLKQATIIVLIKLEELDLDVRIELELSSEKEEPKSIIEQIFDLIKKDEFRVIFRILNQVADKSNEMDLQDEIASINDRYKRLIRVKSQQTITMHEEDLELNKISSALVELTKELQISTKERQISTEERQTVSPEKQVLYKILFLASNPTDAGRLRLGVELRDIEEGLKLAEHRDSFEMVSKFAVRAKGVSRAMLEEEPQILYFSGHGVLLKENPEASEPDTRSLVWEELEDTNSLEGLSGGIALEDNEGNAKIVKAEALEGLFELFGEQIKIVFLNGCYAEDQADAIIKQVPYVIGMNSAVPDDTAIAFATGFYDALGAGRDIEFAFKLAKNRIELEGMAGADLAVMKKRD